MKTNTIHCNICKKFFEDGFPKVGESIECPYCNSTGYGAYDNSDHYMIEWYKNENSVFCKDCKHAILYLCKQDQTPGICSRYLDKTEIIEGNKANRITGEKPSDYDWYHPGYSCVEAREDENLCGKSGRGFEQKDSAFTEFCDAIHKLKFW